MGILATERLSAPLIVGAFLMALIWGAAHALTPGHGKAVVAAYLVGSRSTARHAVFLALTVTLTHTFAVFALGLVAYFALRNQVPWRSLPWIGTFSGLIVAGLGAAMLVSRLRALSAGRSQPRDHEHGLQHDHAHGHDHSHGHDHHHHDDDHDDPHHEHGHSHLPPGADGRPVTWRSLLGLGISGGLLPCPSALVLLLAAVAVNRTALGIALVVAFSVGLATVLTAIGLLFVKGGKLVGRIPHGAWTLRVLPIASAMFILAVGVWLTVEAARTIRL